MKLKYLVLLAFALNQSAIAAQRFATPEAAGEALINALSAKDKAALENIFGKENKTLIESGDAVADANQYAAFVSQYQMAHEWKAVSKDRMILETGEAKSPFAIPLQRIKGQWVFDTKVGRAELLTRRIGLNELSAIESLKSIVVAQQEYYTSNPEGSALLHYADRFVSSPEQRDGLYWANQEGKPESPLGPLFAQAATEGYGKTSAPYHGYYFKILKKQGPAAKGGAYSYIEKGKMFGGFAVIAWPASYGKSGIMTLMTNQDGVIYQRNLGPNTAEQVKSITSFNPDTAWAVTE